MVANRYTLRLHKGMNLRLERDENLDPRDDARLRELLEDMVVAVMGGLDLDLSAGWRLVVHSQGGGRIWAWVSVDDSGRTVVKR